MRRARFWSGWWCGWLLAAGTGFGAPVVTGFAPTFGGPGTQVTVAGSGLGGATRVEFEMVPADFRVTTNGQIIAVVPVGAVSGRIRVTAGSQSWLTAGTFHVPPRITDFAPTRGGPGTTVVIHGANFDGATNVQFNGVNAGFAVIGPTQISASVPNGASNGVVRAGTAIGSAISEGNFIVLGPGPVIDTFDPPFAAPGGKVRLTGLNFFQVQGVRFNGVPASFQPPATPTALDVWVPNHATTGRVEVVTAAGTGVSTNDFQVTRVPVVTNFFPRTAGGGTLISIQGVNFTGVTGVWFGQVAAGGWSVTADGHQISATVPANVPAGAITVGNGYGYGTSVELFLGRLPWVERFTPVLGGPGSKVTLFGQNLAGISEVTFNGVPAFSAPGAASTQWDAWVPAGASTGPIRVQNASGGFTTSSNFVVTPPFAFITRFEPAGGPPGTEVLIYGTNFGGAPVVRFNGALDATAYVVSEAGGQKIFARAPAGSSTGPLTVSGPGGGSTNAARYHYPPWVYGFEPTNGFVGETVVIEGTNFTGATQVRFNEAAAAFSVEPGRLVAVVPEQATRGRLLVGTPGGVIATTNEFGVLPRITNVVPSLGATGTVVRIQGTSLKLASAVYFNEVPAVFTNLSFAEIAAVVPASARTGPIRVATADGGAESPAAFWVVGPSDLALTSQASAQVVAPGSEVTFTWAIHNPGPWSVSDLVVRGPAPMGFTNVNVSVTGGAGIGGGLSNGWAWAHVERFEGGGTATVAVHGAFSEEGYATFGGGVTAREADPDLSNNEATATVLVLAASSRTLRISRVPGQPAVRLAWPASSVPLALQSRGELLSGEWRAVTNIPAAVSGQNVVTNPSVGSWDYYRLEVVPPAPAGR